MPFLSRIRSLGRNLIARRRIERDLDDELGAYLAGLIDEKRAAGMTPAAAERAARIEMGGLEQVKEEVRHVSPARLAREFAQDLAYGVRVLRKNPGFTFAAVLALSLGIGANAAMFSVAYGILLRPLPYPEADRIAAVYLRYSPRDFAYGTLCIRDYLMWKEENRVFEEPSLYRSLRLDIGGREAFPEQVQGASVTAGFFPTLAMRPLIGRAFSAGEDDAMAPALAVVSESLWRRRFAASPAVLGRTLLVDGEPFTVIGVMPTAFRFPRRDTELWTNLRLSPPSRYGPWLYRGVARLKPGATLEQAQAEVNRIGLRMMLQNPFYKRLTMPVLSLRDALLGTALKPAILLLVGAVGLVLLIAVVNVANLILARAATRRREMALRISLGAARGRLVRQLLTESVLLAAIGGIGGFALASVGVALLRAWNPGNLPLIDAVRLDAPAVVFMGLITMLTGALFGLAPAVAGARDGLHAVIKQGERGAAPRLRSITRSALVVSEIALSLMLLLGAGLLLRSFRNLHRVTAGVSAPPRSVLTMLISPVSRKYDDPRTGLAFYDEVLRRARNVPGVEIAAVADALPPDRANDADSFQIEGQSLAPGELNPIVPDVTVGPDFFGALGVPLVKGRVFTEHDTAEGAPVAVVSEAFARRFFSHQDALGKRLKQSGPGFGNPWLTVVGIVGDVKYLGLTSESDPAYYMPFAQNYGRHMVLVVRSRGDAAALAAPLRREIQAIDAGVTLSQTGTMEQAFRASVSQPRFDTMLLTLFAGMALLLAAIGIYGLVAYSVAQRTHEIGVRMALGAAQSQVLQMVLREGASLAAIGIAIGLAGALALTRLLKAMLFGVGATDALTFLAAPAALMAVVVLATLVPALRAARISPVVTLRYE